MGTKSKNTCNYLKSRVQLYGENSALRRLLAESVSLLRIVSLEMDESDLRLRCQRNIYVTEKLFPEIVDLETEQR